MKVNKRKVLAKLREAIKAKQAEKQLLTMGLFAPSQRDVEDELDRLGSYRYNNFRKNLDCGEEV